MRALIGLGLLWVPAQAWAFCGAYVAGADVSVSNGASQVAITRVGERTSLTMSNDVVGDDLRDFAMLVPVPKVLAREDIAVLSPDVFEQLNGYTQPRMVRYECSDFRDPNDLDTETGTSTDWDTEANPEVGVEARYIVGEYEIVLLSADDAGALTRWLTENNYVVPEAVVPVLQQYLDAGSYFFAARVQPENPLPTGHMLSPLRISYTTKDFVLPIRLGAASSSGEQDLVVHVVSEGEYGAVAISNYPEFTVQDECMPRGVLATDLAEHYQGEFTAAWTDEGSGRAWTTEYAWFGGGCDPCSPYDIDAQLLSDVGFLAEGQSAAHSGYMVTRLHMRYVPSQAHQDVALYYTEQYASQQMRYIEYKQVLEDRFEICGEGWAEEPGACYPDTDDETPNPNESVPTAGQAGCAGCSGLGSTGWLCALPLFALLALRRRRV